MKRTVVIELEIEGDAHAALYAVEGALDAGVLQDEVAVMGAIGDGAAFTILSVTSRLEAEEEPAPLAPVVNSPPSCPLRAGWDYFDDQEVQRDDAAKIFETDDDARAHIRACSFCLMDLMVAADGLPVEPLLRARCGCDAEGSAT
jgi:hypothetical protein